VQFELLLLRLALIGVGGPAVLRHERVHGGVCGETRVVVMQRRSRRACGTDVAVVG
jgi:hypothetical protein